MNAGIKGKVTANGTTTSGESNAWKETWRFRLIAILLVVIVLLLSASLTVSLITRSGEGEAKSDIEKELRNTTDILNDEAQENVTITTTATAATAATTYTTATDINAGTLPGWTIAF